MTDIKKKIIETPINSTLVLDGAGTSQKFFAELEAVYRHLPDPLAMKATYEIGHVLDRMTHPGRPDRYLAQLAMLLAITANMSADLLKVLEPARPVTDPERDPRVAAIKRFHAHVIEEAFLGRALTALMQSKGMA